MKHLGGNGRRDIRCLLVPAAAPDEHHPCQTAATQHPPSHEQDDAATASGHAAFAAVTGEYCRASASCRFPSRATPHALRCTLA